MLTCCCSAEAKRSVSTTWRPPVILAVRAISVAKRADSVTMKGHTHDFPYLRVQHGREVYSCVGCECISDILSSSYQTVGSQSQSTSAGARLICDAPIWGLMSSQHSQQTLRRPSDIWTLTRVDCSGHGRHLTARESTIAPQRGRSQSTINFINVQMQARLVNTIAMLN
jgi:hypothetical protein